MKKDRVNIICLLWKGNFRGRNYRDSDVWRLYEMVHKNIDRPFKMYCLTNDMAANLPAEKIELLFDYSGWWSKIELFRPDLPCGRTLYLDLDTYIVGSLQPILDFKGNLVMFPSPYKNNGYQAGTMLFTPGSLSWVLRKFTKNARQYMRQYRSEQDIYEDWLPDQPTFPAHWLMKLGEVKKKKALREETIIVSGNKDGEFRNIELLNQNLKA